MYRTAAKGEDSRERRTEQELRKLYRGQSSSEGREAFCMDGIAAKGEGSSTADSAAAKRGSFRHGQNSSQGRGGL